MQARKRLGELLVETGALDELQLRAALGHQRQWGGKLGRTLVDLKLVTEGAVVSALSKRLECEVAALEPMLRTPELEEALRLVPGELARKHAAVPLAASRTTLTVAMEDPANVAAVDELSFRTGRRVKALLAGPRAIARAVNRLYGAGDRDGGIDVDFDVHADPPLDDAHVFDSSPAKFQERFYRSSLREPPGPQLVREPLPTPAPVAGMAPATVSPARAAPAPAGGLAGLLLKMASGAEVPSLPPGALVAAVTSALLRRGLVTEAEVVAELWRARAAAPGAAPKKKAAPDDDGRPL